MTLGNFWDIHRHPWVKFGLSKGHSHPSKFDRNSGRNSTRIASAVVCLLMSPYYWPLRYGAWSELSNGPIPAFFNWKLTELCPLPCCTSNLEIFPFVFSRHQYSPLITWTTMAPGSNKNSNKATDKKAAGGSPPPKKSAFSKGNSTPIGKGTRDKRTGIFTCQKYWEA